MACYNLLQFLLLFTLIIISNSITFGGLLTISIMMAVISFGFSLIMIKMHNILENEVITNQSVICGC